MVLLSRHKLETFQSEFFLAAVNLDMPETDRLTVSLQCFSAGRLREDIGWILCSSDRLHRKMFTCNSLLKPQVPGFYMPLASQTSARYESSCR